MLEKIPTEGHRKKLALGMGLDSLALFHSGSPVPMTSDENYPFYVDNNFYYLTGIDAPDVYLAIEHHEDGAIKSHLFIQRRDPQLEKWIGRSLRVFEAQERSGIESVRFNDELDNYLKDTKFSSLYWDQGIPDHQKVYIQKRIETQASDKKMMDAGPLLAEIRLVKGAYEIELMKHAIELAHLGIEEMRNLMKPGVMEYELAAAFEYAVTKRGAQSLSFATIAASGSNATILHYIENNNAIKNEDGILFDLGARFKGYCSDISRTYPVSGRFSDRQAAVYAAVLSAQKKVITLYRSGNHLPDIQEEAKRLLYEACEERAIYVPDGDIFNYYYHSIGHSLGLDTHDSSNFRDIVLEPGMVITCEPGLYIEGMGFGVRIEDDILITDGEPIVLSEMIPKELKDVCQ